MPVLTRADDVWTLDLGTDENRFSPAFLDSVAEVTDELARGDAPVALVTTGTGKFFSNGLDLDWLGAHADQLESYVARVEGLLAAVLALPVPTVAAVNGHAFGAGAMLALAHDVRLMRADRGFFCFPEVDIQIPFRPGMAALIQAKLAPAAAAEAMTTGRRYGGPDAVAAGLVDEVATEDGLLAAATEVARSRAGKHTGTLAAIKGTLYAVPLAALRR